MSLFYLFRATLKNKLLDVLHSPAKLVTTLLFIAILAMSAVGSSGPEGGLGRDMSELYALILALYAGVFVVTVLHGFSSGASFYTMADVHFLFPAPLSPRVVLLYGLIRQMGASLLIGFFLLFQYAWLNMTYGLSAAGLAYILFGYAVTMFAAQLCAMALYSFTCASERARRAAKIAFFAVCAVFAALLLAAPLSAPGAGSPLQALTGAASAPLFSLFPVAGWMRGSVAAFMEGRVLSGLLYIVPVVIGGAALVACIARSRADFYEDVLAATEVSHSAITAKKEGTLAENAPRHVRVGKVGIGKGAGAGAFYYKHLLEDRRSRFLLLDSTSIVFLVINWVFAFLMRGNGLIPVLIFSVYMQMFSVATGRWVRELLLPYVYMTPENAFIKLFHICRENILKTAAEAAVLFIPMAFILGLTPAETAACILMRISFGLLFIAGNILIERVLGTLANKAVILLLYMIIMILICLPGIVIGAVFSGILGAAAPALAVVAVWNTACSALIVFLCRNILDCAELSNR